jgi:competence protein ComEC
VRETVARHPRHLVLGALVAGLLLGPIWPAGAVLAALVALAIAGPRLAGVLAVAAVLAGAAGADARLAALDGGPLRALDGRALTASAVLLEPVRERPTGARAGRIRLLGGPADGAIAAARVPAGTGWPRAEVGEILVISGRVVPLSPAEAYQRPRGARMALEVDGARPTGRRRAGVAGALDGVRRRAERALETGAPPAQAAVLRGMVLGQDEAIGAPVREEFRRSGLAHLLAASGQNVMLLAALAIAAAAALGAGLRARLGVALVLVALYVPLAGGGPSIQRAGVMGAAGIVAAMAGRPASRWYAVGLAAAVTLVANPLASREPGWQLSFAAVVALLGLAPGIRAALQRGGCPRALADALAITLAATVGTAPLMSMHFGSLSLASLPANLLAAPAVAPVMWLGTLAAAVGQVSAAAAEPLSAVASLPVAYVEWVAQATSEPALASVSLELPGPAVTAAAYAALAAGAVTLRALSRRMTSAGARRPGVTLAVVGCLVLAVTMAAVRRQPVPRAPGELVISFLSVGQGDATLLQHDDTAVLFDTGPPGAPILRELRAAGVDELDVLVLTHAQADHEGMADAVLGAHRTRLVLNGGTGDASPVQRRLPAAAAAAGARVAPARAGERLRVGSLELRILWPPPRPAGAAAAGDPNLRAVVAHVRLGDFDLLLPADAESEVTAALDLPQVEALKVAHHGSEDPGLPRELSRLEPRVAAIEVGEGNTYGHPAPDTLAALRSVPAVVRTDRDGTVRLRVRAGSMRIERDG